MADKKISELDLALLINDDAEFPISQDNAGEPTTFKGRITQLGTKIAEDMTFSNLRTTSKKLVGAINELLSLGSPIIIGTTAPTSSQGADGNIYVQYTEGTGGADDEVDGIYVKIDGAWCEIQTGGGSGTTDYEDLSNKPQVNSVELVGNKSLDDLGIMPASLSKTVSGSLVHIEDGADNIPVKSLVSQIVATGGGGTPDAPIAINGFDSGVITRCGKNLLPTTLASGSQNGTTWVVSSDGHITVSGTPSVKTTLQLCSVFSFTVRTPCIYKNFGNLPTGVRIYCRRVHNGVTSFPTISNGYKLITGDIYNVFLLEINTTYDGNEFTTSCQIELGDTATTYEAYNGNTYEFTFGQTVYSGHFDNKGNLVITHGYIASYNGETINEPWVSSMDNYVPNTSPSTGAQVVYPLTSPITLSITSQDIPTLLSENNIFSNTGDVEVNYYTNKADEIVEVSKATASTPLHSYSTDEQVVGTWIDGSTIYEKTFDLGSDINIDYTSWTETSISWQTLNVNRLVGTEGFTSSGGTFAGTLLASKKSNGNIEIQTPRNGTATGVRYLTIQYTKSST